METLSILIRLEGKNKYAMLLVIVDRNLITHLVTKKKKEVKIPDNESTLKHTLKKGPVSSLSHATEPLNEV